MHYMGKYLPQNRISILVFLTTIGFAVLLRLIVDTIANKMKKAGVSAVPKKC